MSRLRNQSSFDAIARSLADVIIAGPFEMDAIESRLEALLGHRYRWIRPLSRNLTRRFAGNVRPRQVEVVRFLKRCRQFDKALQSKARALSHRHYHPAAMAPSPAAFLWQLPMIETPGKLAEVLQLAPRQLDWFADTNGWESAATSERLQHYRYRLLNKRFGTIRIIESPKPRLKAIQRWILHKILDLVPPHPAAHGFRRGSSIRSFAQPHCRQDIVMRFDLSDFFPTIALARIQSLFRTLGYPERVADLLAGLCSNTTPESVFPKSFDSASMHRSHDTLWKYVRPHLPQGAPTSPSLANLCAFSLDCRLQGFASLIGMNYTRYADDLAFSGNSTHRKSRRRIQATIASIVVDEGFLLNHYKTRGMPSSQRQRLAGLTVNAHPNINRHAFDCLRATLFNCVKHGLASQNVDGIPNFFAHLQGRVAFIKSINPHKAERLIRLMERIKRPE